MTATLHGRAGSLLMCCTCQSFMHDFLLPPHQTWLNILTCCLEFRPTDYTGAFASCVDIAGHHISGLGIALIVVAGEQGCLAMQLCSIRLPALLY